ncbi:MAG: RIP metalloprotease RseP [Rubrimonas sp.]|uniref:RIP metalloprotease RseP n=1 Tax=Rubrimonas sp. TaxID=2036015 RepID=UPI002FDD96CA
MSFLAELPLIGPTLAAAIPFILVLGIVVAVHEYGHYIVARWCGIGADVFSVGFGKELIGWTDSRGTRWKISALPLGGYVKFYGDADASSSARDDAAIAALPAEKRAHSFHTASVERRAATVAAGPFANFLLSIAIFAVMAMVQGAASPRPVIGAIAEDADPSFAAAFAPGDEVRAIDGAPVADFAGLLEALRGVEGREARAVLLRDGVEREVAFTFAAPARIDGLTPGGAAEEAGLRAGDVIVAIDGAQLGGFADLQARVAASEGRPLTVEALRGEETLTVSLTPQLREAADPATGETVTRPLIGITKSATEVQPLIESVGPLSALAVGVERTWTIVDLSLTGIRDVVVGAQPADEVLGGPIRIAQISGDAADQGIVVFIGLVAVLSTSIGLINLFPIPILDGGHLMFYAIEKATGRPLRERWMEIGNGIGLALVLSLMIFATFNDIARL